MGDRFRFTHEGNRFFIYDAVLNGDKVTVSWKNSVYNVPDGSITYEASFVLHCILTGHWKVV